MSRLTFWISKTIPGESGSGGFSPVGPHPACFFTLTDLDGFITFRLD